MTTPVPEPSSVQWRLRAACRGMDLDPFYPPEADLVPPEAEQVCDSCPVIESCRRHALRHELYGVWAGLSPVARERLRRALRINLTAPEVPAPLANAELAADMHRRGAAVHVIAAELGVSRRTIHRYLPTNEVVSA